MDTDDIKVCLNTEDVVLEDTTPMVRQYLDIKKNYMDLILLYRMGDFYETFFQDATLVSRELEITLTKRDGGKIGKIPLAGIPIKAIDNYLPKLIEKGYKVAICEQLDDSSDNVKGLFRRDVVKVITAGTVMDNTLLQGGSNNYLLALYKMKNKDLYGIAYTDITTGEFKFTQANYEQTLAELARIKPAEVLVLTLAEKLLPFQVVPELKIDLPEEITSNYNCTKLGYKNFDYDKGLHYFKKVFNRTPDMFTKEECTCAVIAVGVILEYIIETQKSFIPVFNSLEYYQISDFLAMDISTRKNLELLETTRDKSKTGSLLWAIKRTNTGMGERLLKKWITQPLKNINEINARHDAVEELITKTQERAELAKILSGVADVERLITKVSNNSANPRDIVGLKNSLSDLPRLNKIVQNLNTNCIEKEVFENEKIVDLVDIIDKTLFDNPPVLLKDGGLIKDNVNETLDYYRDLKTNGDAWLKQYEEKEKELTGIKFLKVGFSKVFGYFIEVSNSNKDLVPQRYIRRQTLTSGERYITEELKKHEDEILSASTKMTELEYNIFSQLREYLREFVEPIRKIGENIAKLDVLYSFAQISIESNYVRPVITDRKELVVRNGRHAVVERLLPLGQYVSNDLSISSEKNATSAPFMILTGPNMAGKSTYMRQNALLIILAQAGCFVPADYAQIGVVDKIFTRVGAVDDLSLGQSTFMVEMLETAYILNSATENSFILLDEIGRGTSTYDGVAIAWAVAEYIATKIKARTIFATHYHELNVMANKYPQIKNFRVTITETEKGIEFLRKVVEGSASKSYGIHVAQMAGLPSEVVKNAQGLMTKLQKDYSKDLSANKRKHNEDIEVPQLSFDLQNL